MIGISLSGVRVGGGILLMLVSIDIVFGRSIGAPAGHAGPGGDDPDLAVFPVATPIIAGPGAITAAIVRGTEAHNDVGILLTALSSEMILKGLRDSGVFH